MTSNDNGENGESTALATKHPVAAELERLAPQIRAALPAHIKPERLIRVAVGSLRRTPKLMECHRASLLGSIMQCAVLGLEPDNGLGHAYLVPFRGEATLIVGYKGMVDLARRSGQVSTIYSRCVYEGDQFDFGYGLDPFVVHKPIGADPTDVAKITHAYAVCVLRDGGRQFEVMTRQEIERIKEKSPGAKKSDSPWRNHFAEMAKKTAIRRLFKMLPVSVEMQRAVAIDEAAENGYRPQLDIGIEEVLGGAVEPAGGADELNADLETEGVD